MSQYYYVVSPLAVVHKSESELTYSSSAELASGQVVKVPVGKKTVAGVVLRKTKRPSFATKPLIPIDTVVLPPELLQLHEWLASYYATHPVAVWQTMLPTGITKNRRNTAHTSSPPLRDRTNYVLNTSQENALARLEDQVATTSLLHGITGSGKTAVYIELAKRTIKKGRSVIILVPEIALTSQLVAEFTNHIPNILVTHSSLTESQRHTIWLEALHSKKPRVIIGPRSALFTPFYKLGLIVIDECHEPSYKQEKSPRYSALRTASVLAQYHGAVCVFGSATPSIQDYYLASSKQNKSAVVVMDKLAKQNAILPTVEMVNMTVKSNFHRSYFLSTTLLAAIETSLANGHQSLLFHNRRGSAPITLCENCGWSAACPNCFTPLTLHTDKHILRCHICNHTEKVPTSCPACGHASVIHKGIGTKRIVEEVTKLFPEAKVARFDGDNETNETLDKQYQALYDGDIDIIVGTQVIAKGLDLPKLRTVGVVQADSGLALPDFQSSERVFQLLAQVVGRVGRNEHESTVVLQSYQPDHPSVRYGIARDYEGFYNDTLLERRRAYFPPFCYLLKLTCMYKSEKAALDASRKLASTLRSQLGKNAVLLGPTPAFYERVRDNYRWQLIIKSKSRKELVELVKLVPPTHWQFELDPFSLL